jgi:hypothetical protein
MILRIVRSVSIIPCVLSSPMFWVVSSKEAAMIPSVACTVIPCRAKSDAWTAVPAAVARMSFTL